MFSLFSSTVADVFSQILLARLQSPCSVLYRKADIPKVSVKRKCFESIPRCLRRVCVRTRGSHVDGT